MTHFKDYFYGNKISEYGRQNGRVDYATFSKAFDSVLSNDIISKTWGTLGDWEQVSGFNDYSDEIEELEDQIEELEDKKTGLEDTLFNLDDDSNTAAFEDAIEEIDDKIKALDDRKTELEEAQDETPEIYQYYIISDQGAAICEEFGEIVYYNSELDLYVWGVTHWGTAWDYVLTGIECERDENARG